MNMTAPLRRLAYLASVIVLAFSLSACSSLPSIQEASPKQDGQEELVVALSFDSAPFSLEDAGKLSGYNVDIAAAIAQEMGAKLRFVDLGTGDGIDKLRSNNDVDIVMSSNTQNVTVDGVEVLVRNYNANAPGLFTVTTNGERALATVQDVEKASIAVQGESVSDKLISKLFPAAKRLQLRSINECFEALKSGQVKYVACDSLQGSYLAKNYENVAPAGLLENAESLNILARSKSGNNKFDAIRRAADKLKAGGVFDLIATKWFGPYQGSTTTGSLIELDEQRKKAIAELETSGLASAAAEAVSTQQQELSPGANVSLPEERSGR